MPLLSLRRLQIGSGCFPGQSSGGNGGERGPTRPAEGFLYLAHVCLITGVYFAAAKLGLSLAIMHKNVSLVWPPTGIALAALLVFGFHLWPGITLVAFLINASTDVSLATAAGIGIGNTLEALTGTYLLRRFVRFRNSLERLQDVLGLVGLAAVLSTTVSATIGVASLCLGGAAPWAAYGSLWWQWWLGDAMGALVVGPVLLTWGTEPRVGWQPRKVAEAVALLVVLVSVSRVVFGGWFTTEPTSFPLAFVVFPFVIWAALRFGQRGATTAIFVVSGLAVWGTVQNVGPFLGKTPTQSLLLLQIFMSMVAVTGLVLAATITQRQWVEEALRNSEQRYRALFENAAEIVYTLDLAGNFTSLNRAGELITGYTCHEVLKMNFAQLAAHADLARHLITRQVTEETPMVYELEIVAKGGHRVPLEVSTGRISEAGMPIGVQGIARDITERKQTELMVADAHAKLSGWVEELERRTRQITLLSEMGDLLQCCLTAEEAYTVITQFAQKLFPTESGMLGVLDASKQLVAVVAVWGGLPSGEHMFPPERCWALRRGRMYVGETSTSGVPCQHLDPSLATGYLCVPMMAQGEPLGLLHLQGGPSGSGRGEPSLNHLRESHQRLAVSVAEHIALALANLKLQETLRSQAIRDPLTGLFNRRYMEEFLVREVHRAERTQRPLGIIMFDIDHFKQVNDTFGHEAGDALLHELGALVKANLRGGDVACRYGGEEFVLILPEASLDDTRRRAEQLREAVRQLRVSHRGQALGPLILSLGVAAFPNHGESAEALIRAADTALYQAKAEGRDRVMVAEEAGNRRARGEPDHLDPPRPD